MANDKHVNHSLLTKHFYRAHRNWVHTMSRTVQKKPDLSPQRRHGTTLIGGSVAGGLADSRWECDAGGAEDKTGGGTRREAKHEAPAIVFDLGLCGDRPVETGAGGLERVGLASKACFFRLRGMW